MGGRGGTPIGPTVPSRPLFAWAQDEALLNKLSNARLRYSQAQRGVKRAAKGQKKRAMKIRRDALHALLRLENEIAGKERHHG